MGGTITEHNWPTMASRSSTFTRNICPFLSDSAHIISSFLNSRSLNLVYQSVLSKARLKCIPCGRLIAAPTISLAGFPYVGEGLDPP